MRRIKSAVLLSFAVLAAGAPVHGTVTENWTVPPTSDWRNNGLLSHIEIVSTGGNPGGYLRTWGTGLQNDLFDIGALVRTDGVEDLFTGDYAAKGVVRMSVDIKYVSGSFDGTWLRVQAWDNGWIHPVFPTYSPVWQQLSVEIDPSWTDAEARAAGWFTVSEVFPTAVPTVNSFAQTLSYVGIAEIRISGIGDVEAGIDNFTLYTSVTTVPAPSALLVGVVGSGAVAWLRRRRSL